MFIMYFIYSIIIIIIIIIKYAATHTECVSANSNPG